MIGPASPLASRSAIQPASTSSSSAANAANDAAMRRVEITAAPASAAISSTTMPLRNPPAACISSDSATRSVSACATSAALKRA